MNKNDLIDCFNSVTPENTQKQKMLRMILDSKKGGIVPMKRAAKKISLAAAVIVLCVLTATTALAIGFGWNEKLIEYLNPSEKQMEALSGAVSTPEATLTKNGVTITVKQTLTDSFGIYVLYEMTVPEGIELNDGIRWEFDVLDVTTEKIDGDYGGAVIGSEILEQAGNKRTVLLHRDQTTPLKNGTAKLIFKNLEYIRRNGPTGPVEITPLVKGEWDLEWEFNYVDTSKTIEVNKPVSINESNDTITKVVISPMSVCAFVRGDDILGSARPVVNFKDGSKLAYDKDSKNKSFSYYLVNENELIYENQLYYRLENIINVADVESITIGDVTIPIV